MKVALGTFEVTEEERKAIKKALGFKGGKSSREETRDYLLKGARDVIDSALSPEVEAEAEAEIEVEGEELTEGTATEETPEVGDEQ